jgi:ABC-type Fe3+/spermidine/putrescine transport system ATPase subunit
MPQIRLVGIHKSFGEVKAADGLDLTVNDGEYLCILGPTGAGKTTCMRIICGLTRPDSGQVFFGDRDVTNLETNAREAAMLSQTYSLFPQMNVNENVMFGPYIKGWDEEESKQLVKSILKMVHMGARSQAYPNELSGGQQQRIALARAMASGSQVLLLDEPLRALDARLRLELRKELKSMVKEMGLTAIHVTHDQDEAMEMADRIAIIRNGKIVQVGTPQEVFEKPRTPFVANFVGRSNMIIGKVRAVMDGRSEIETERGAVFQVADTSRPVGSKVLVAIKVGNTRISLTEEGFFTAHIDRVLFEGSTISVEVTTPLIDGIIAAKLPSRKFDDYLAGMVVDVRWAPDKAYVFDCPEGGLDEAMKVE